MIDVLDLYQYAEDHDIRVDDIQTGVPSLSLQYDGQECIAIDSSAFDEESEFAVAFAHEEGHCATYSFYNVHTKFDVVTKRERRAWIWAIRKLIPAEELYQAVCEGNTEMWQLAEYFGYPQWFVEMAVGYYEGVE